MNLIVMLYQSPLRSLFILLTHLDYYVFDCQHVQFFRRLPLGYFKYFTHLGRAKSPKAAVNQKQCSMEI